MTTLAQARGTGLVYDERYLDHMLPPSGGAPHPESPLRLQRIREMFVARGLDRELTPCTLADMDPSVHKLEDEQTGLGWRRVTDREGRKNPDRRNDRGFGS